MKVNSSMIEEINFNSENGVLTIVWKNGKSTTYSGITQADYDAFVGADSVGKYYHAVFKVNHQPD
jgi:hypothetical protein